MKNKNEMIEESSWEEFKNSGMLWVVNTILQIFGWSIVFEYGPSSDNVKSDDDTDTIINDNTFIRRVYPVKNKFRGFSDNINDEGYKKVTKYIIKNSKELLDAINDM